MKDYKAPQLSIVDFKIIDVLMSSNVFDINDEGYGFDVDKNGGDEIW